MTSFAWALAACGLLFSISPLASTAEVPLESLSVVALAPVEERAVVKSAHGSLHVVQPGDLLPGTAARVLQVLPDKLVLEAQNASQPESGKHLVWLYQRPPAGDGSRVQRLQRHPPAAVPGLSTAPLSRHQLQR